MAPSTRSAAKVLTAVLDESLGNVDPSTFVRRGERYRRAPDLFVNSVTNYALAGTVTATENDISEAILPTDDTTLSTAEHQEIGNAAPHATPTPKTRAPRKVGVAAKAAPARKTSLVPKVTKRKTATARQKLPAKRQRLSDIQVSKAASSGDQEAEGSEERMEDAADTAIEQVENDDPQDGDFQPDFAVDKTAVSTSAPPSVRKPRITRTPKAPKAPKTDVATIPSGSASKQTVSGPSTGPSAAPSTGRVVRAKRAARRVGTAAGSKASAPIVVRPEPDGAPLVWAEVCAKPTSNVSG